MNKPLLKQIIEQVGRNPGRLDMRDYVSARADSRCGSTACIAGWAVCLDMMNRDKRLSFDKVSKELCDKWGNINWDYEAGKLLRIDERQGVRLFRLERWPEPFRDDYSMAECGADREGMARAAISRIRHFMRTGGADSRPVPGRGLGF